MHSNGLTPHRGEFIWITLVINMFKVCVDSCNTCGIHAIILKSILERRILKNICQNVNPH